MTGAQAQSDHVRAFFHGELKTLDADLQGQKMSTDRPMTLHVADLRHQIARALDPSVQAAAPARSMTDLTVEDAMFNVTSASDICCPDYIVSLKER